MRGHPGVPVPKGKDPSSLSRPSRPSVIPMLVRPCTAPAVWPCCARVLPGCRGQWLWAAAWPAWLPCRLAYNSRQEQLPCRLLDRRACKAKSAKAGGGSAKRSVCCTPTAGQACHDIAVRPLL